jgi:hypothetical protein
MCIDGMASPCREKKGVPMSRDWSKTTIFNRCLAFLVVAAAVIVLAGRDDSSRRTSSVEDPAVPSVAVDPGRAYVVVLRPEDASDGAVARADGGVDIWQAALRSHDGSNVEVRVQNLLRSFCDVSEPDALDFDAVMADTRVCLAVDGYKDDGQKDPGFELAVETWAGSQGPCDNPLCERFRLPRDSDDDRGTVDREALDQSAPEIIAH